MVNGPVSFSGLVSGLNTQSIISAEMAVYEQPLTNLQTEQSTINTQDRRLPGHQHPAPLAPASGRRPGVSRGVQRGLCSSILEPLRGHRERELGYPDRLADVRRRPAGCRDRPRSPPERWHRRTTLWHSGSILIGSGGAALGITSMDAGSGLATGNHALAVTQSSAGATVSGTTPVAASTTIGASNDQLDVADRRRRPKPHVGRRHVHAQPIGSGRAGGLRGRSHRFGLSRPGSCPLRRPSRALRHPCRSPEVRASPPSACRPVRPSPAPTA